MKNLYGRLWRWHFFAALIVIPFVLWQSVTGTLYLWSEWWVDRAHPQMRFVKAQQPLLPLSEQIQSAIVFAGTRAAGAVPTDSDREGTIAPSGAEVAASNDRASGTAAPSSAAHHHGAAGPSSGLAVERILLSDDPARSTTVLFQRGGLPFPVFVDPYTGAVLGQLSATAWLPGISRALHGGWPLGEAGSWLLELGDGWAILMLATGLYLWWPRGRGLAAFWPRTGAGTRVLLRDLHSCVAVWFSVVFLFFLISALPWTAFWGGKLLSTIESNIGQKSPTGFSPGGAPVARFSNASVPIEQAVAAARRANVHGTLDIRLAPWPGAPLFMTNTHVLPSQDRTVLADPVVGEIRGDFTNAQIPVIPRLVALGIHVHQADFGPINIWLNTAFATSLIWLSVTGVLSWWNRRPAGRLAAPPKLDVGTPLAVRAFVAVACVLMPLFGASILFIVLAESAVMRLRIAPATS
jgi:uncharacterized iron-regulated membrane protein